MAEAMACPQNPAETAGGASGRSWPRGWWAVCCQRALTWLQAGSSAEGAAGGLSTGKRLSWAQCSSGRRACCARGPPGLSREPPPHPKPRLWQQQTFLTYFCSCDRLIHIQRAAGCPACGGLLPGHRLGGQHAHCLGPAGWPVHSQGFLQLLMSLGLLTLELKSQEPGSVPHGPSPQGSNCLTSHQQAQFYSPAVLFAEK